MGAASVVAGSASSDSGVKREPRVGLTFATCSAVAGVGTAAAALSGNRLAAAANAVLCVSCGTASVAVFRLYWRQSWYWGGLATAQSAGSGGGGGRAVAKPLSRTAEGAGGTATESRSGGSSAGEHGGETNV